MRRAGSSEPNRRHCSLPVVIQVAVPWIPKLPLVGLLSSHITPQSSGVHLYPSVGSRYLTATGCGVTTGIDFPSGPGTESRQLQSSWRRSRPTV